MDTRESAWQRLSSEPFDLLVVGGGVTGAGALRDAARRGLKAALVEAEDFASGTSSRSSKLVHGGLRYLENGELGLVFEAVSERRTLMNIAPHLVTPLGFVFPVYSHSRVSLTALRAGLWVYDGLSLFRSPKLHRNLTRQDAERELPILETRELKGAPLFYDCATDDARLTLETVLDAVGLGAVALNHARVTGVVRDTGGRVVGVRVRDCLTGVEVVARATVVINATGPWSDRLRSLGREVPSQALRPTKGVHVVFDAKRLPLAHAVVCTHPADGRVMFAVPWGDRAYVGTTDTDFEGDPSEVAADGGDVDYILACCRAYFPAAALSRDDVISTWAGLRPLVSQDGTASASSVSREHSIWVDPDGLVSIAGGKLTTYRRMGAEVVSRALDLMKLMDRMPQAVTEARTGREPLPGGVDWPERDDVQAVADRVREASEGRLADDVCAYLAERYGTRSVAVARTTLGRQGGDQRLLEGRPELAGLVDWAVEQELAQTVTDMLVRRTQVFFRDLDQGLGCVGDVADRMGALLGWTPERRLAEVVAYQEEVERSRRWKQT